MPAAARPRWGYHRLSDRHARALVAHAAVPPGSLVLDLGAGTGAITRHLVGSGATVLAIELHPGRARQLGDRYAGPLCRVIVADVTEAALPARPFRVVANPPFAALATVMRRLTARGSQLERADLVVPAYAAARWSRDRTVQRRFSTHIACRLPACAFEPPASRPTAVLVVERRRRPQRGQQSRC